MNIIHTALDSVWRFTCANSSARSKTAGVFLTSLFPPHSVSPISIGRAPAYVREFFELKKSGRKWIIGDYASVDALAKEAGDTVIWANANLTSEGSVKIDRPQITPQAEDVPVLDSFSGLGYGARWGVSDWSDDFRKALQVALRRKTPWSTGWYSSKKELYTARITFDGSQIVIDVSVTDDLDSNGDATNSLPRKGVTLETIADLLDTTLEAAIENQKGNRYYAGFSIIKGGRWVETFLVSRSDYLDRPMGDCYHKWGFQGESKIPTLTKQKLEDWAQSWNGKESEFTVGNFTIRPWSDSD